MPKLETDELLKQWAENLLSFTDTIGCIGFLRNTLTSEGIKEWGVSNETLPGMSDNYGFEESSPIVILSHTIQTETSRFIAVTMEEGQKREIVKFKLLSHSR